MASSINVTHSQSAAEFAQLTKIPRAPFARTKSRTIAPFSPRNASRTFTTTPMALRKGGKSAFRKQDAVSSPNDANSQAGTVDDPHDFSSLDSGIRDVLQKLRDDLSKLRKGGRFNPELLERVSVRPDKASKETYNLGLLGQVVPKGGRSVIVLVGQAEHVKPIISAIQATQDLNLQPQQDPHNALQLNIAIPSPTKESRDQAQAQAKKAGETAFNGVRNVRAALQKRLRAMELGKVARPDDLRKAHKDMEKVVEKANGEVKTVVEAAKKGLENS